MIFPLHSPPPPHPTEIMTGPLWSVFWSKSEKNNYKEQAKPQETKEVELLA